MLNGHFALGDSAMSEVELAFDSRDQLGEGPMWSVAEQALYWVDIEGFAINRWHPASGAHQRYDIGQHVGTIVFRASGGFVLALRDGFAFWDPETGLTPIADPEADQPDNRFNDGAVDRQGRFWAGTMSMRGNANPQGALYRLDPDASLRKMVPDVYVSNGLGWSPDNKTMYYTDTRPHTIRAYDFDPATGAIENPRVLIHVPDDPGEGGPDGMTVDSEGFIWGARWGGWKICRYDPEGKLEREIKVPVERVTSVMFGGPDLDRLYITTAWNGLSEAERAATQPHAGSVFVCEPGVRGLPEPAYGG